MLKTFFLSVVQARIFQNSLVNWMILHVLLAIALCLGLGMAASRVPVGGVISAFWLAAFLFIVLGWLHTWVLYTQHTWANREKGLMESLFSLAVALVGGVCFLSVAAKGDYQNHSLPLFMAVGAFLLPFFLDRAILVREQRPKSNRPAWMITGLGRVKERSSAGNRASNKYLKLLFKPDRLGYLPKEILVPVSPQADQLLLGEVLENGIWFNNFRKQPDSPIEVCYDATAFEKPDHQLPPLEKAITGEEPSKESEKRLKPFVWEFRRPGISVFRHRYLDPHLSLFGNKVPFYHSEEKGERFLLHGEFAEVIVIRRLQK